MTWLLVIQTSDYVIFVNINLWLNRDGEITYYPLDNNLDIYYIKNKRDATLAVWFINNCMNTLHVSDAYRLHHQEYIKL